MKKAFVALAVAGLLGGPLAAVAGANPVQWIKETGVPMSSCEWQALLGVQNVKACEDEVE